MDKFLRRRLSKVHRYGPIRFPAALRENRTTKQYGKFSDGNWVNPALNQEYNDVRYKDFEKEILKNYNVNTFCDFFDPAYPATISARLGCQAADTSGFGRVHRIHQGA